MYASLVILYIIQNVESCFRQTVVFSDSFNSYKNVNGNDFMTHVRSNEECQLICLADFNCHGFNTNGFVCELISNNEQEEIVVMREWVYVKKTVVKVINYVFNPLNAKHIC